MRDCTLKYFRNETPEWKGATVVNEVHSFMRSSPTKRWRPRSSGTCGKHGKKSGAARSASNVRFAGIHAAFLQILRPAGSDRSVFYANMAR